ncbi:HEAT repeat domain-containing protein [Polyangium aurulentum]|uniref:HEAT repeat domain-containing protein n=1 Tax=Polyangium aurulentum TaxID=2567896 RepID=UPI00146A104F|nr:HEAT repeat domain-containing protein [Polyangium aurulentum]UQA57038.1 HEAT repeat domain-containing protein [Polyangium aurulentum]
MSEISKDSALDFLAKHQPMPPDRELSEEQIVTYDEIRKYFIANPAIECIPLLLNSFGDGGGFGVYQLVEDVFIGFSPEDVVPHLAVALRSPHAGVRFWSSQIAQSFPDPRLTDALVALLADEHCVPFAVTALEMIGDPSTIPALEATLQRTSDAYDRGVITQAIDALRPRSET